jgi:O-acetyl-ADP-ribose deacetylase (regulator of RNase III)
MAENGEFDVIVQGCNCFNAMGGGIAKEIKARYPHAAEVDSSTQRGDYNKLGNWTSAAVVTPKESFLIINAYTQYNTSTGADVFEYVAFELILQKLKHQFGGLRIGFPYIGMGLARGDKKVIMEMLERFAADIAFTQGGTVTLVEFG